MPSFNIFKPQSETYAAYTCFSPGRAADDSSAQDFGETSSDLVGDDVGARKVSAYYRALRPDAVWYHRRPSVTRDLIERRETPVSFPRHELARNSPEISRSSGEITAGRRKCRRAPDREYGVKILRRLPSVRSPREGGDSRTPWIFDITCSTRIT